MRRLAWGGIGRGCRGRNMGMSTLPVKPGGRPSRRTDGGGSATAAWQTISLVTTKSLVQNYTHLDYIGNAIAGSRRPIAERSAVDRLNQHDQRGEPACRRFRATRRYCELARQHGLDTLGYILEMAVSRPKCRATGQRAGRRALALEQRHQPAAVALEPAGELELQQDHAHQRPASSRTAEPDRRSRPASARAGRRCARARRRRARRRRARSRVPAPRPESSSADPGSGAAPRSRRPPR